MRCARAGGGGVFLKETPAAGGGSSFVAVSKSDVPAAGLHWLEAPFVKPYWQSHSPK